MADHSSESRTITAQMRQMRGVVAGRVRRLRTERGWSQRQLAERADIDRTHLARFETQAINVSLDVLFRLALALEIRPARLLKGCWEDETTG